MKIMRFMSERGAIHHGVATSVEAQTARLIEGSIFGDYKLTEKEAAIKKILPPVDPVTIIGIGLNYAKHADETGVRYPEIPVMFLKGVNAAVGYGDTILLPKAGPGEVDIEAELAVIIGKKAKNVSPENAMEYILGYCCGNDVSARDWQKHKQKKQWSRGKSFDTFCPLGPWLVTADEIPNPNSLPIRSELNGKMFQESNTADMIFNVPALVSNLSQSITLAPGTVIMTGTPEGVGFARKPPVFLKDGDTVTITIEGIGSLTNPVSLEK